MQEVLTAADAEDSLRARVARRVAAPGFQALVVALILLNALTLGLETSDALMERWGPLLLGIDDLLLGCFTVELALRAYAFRGRFLRDPWGVFDLLIIGIAWVPATDALSVLRALRVLRVLRLVSVVPSLRTVVEAMLRSLPGMGSIVLLMMLIFYVFGVMGAKLFGEDMPDKFGTLGESLFTLFQLMTLDDWAAIVKPEMEANGWTLAFFLSFTLLATFVVLNLFIGVIVDSIQSMRERHASADAAAALAATDAARAEAHLDSQHLLQEVRALRAEIAALREAQRDG
jgi:voltage-gated sodium channel